MTVIIISVVVLIVCAVLLTYNRLVRARNKCNEAVASIDVTLTKRYELVPLLVVALKGYNMHESDVLEGVTARRIGRTALDDKIEDDAVMTGCIDKVILSVEGYPELMADKNFCTLQSQLVHIEDELLRARRYFNGSVREYNTLIMSFPFNIFAKMFGFMKMNMFSVANANERQTSNNISQLSTLSMMALLMSAVCWFAPVSMSAQDEDDTDNSEEIYEYKPSSAANAAGFYIDSYNVNATVHADNTITVNETLDVIFVKQRHGIIRSFPLHFNVDRDISETQDGSEIKEFTYRPDITDIKISAPYSLDEDDEDYLNIRIGDANKYADSEMEYVINYTYKYKDDLVEFGDLLFHTILGPETNTDVLEFTFDIKFDKDIPAESLSRLKVYAGAYGVENELPVLESGADEEDEAGGYLTYVDNNHIAGYVLGLRPQEAVTLYAPLPEGYFEGEAIDFRYHIALASAILLILTSLVFFVFEIVHRKPKPTKTLEYFPPEGMSSAEVGTIIDDSVDDNDLISLIPWLAHRGYLTIDNTGKHPVLYKKKELSGDEPDYIIQFFKTLFPKGKDSLNLKGQRSESFENSWDKTKKKLDKHFTDERSLSKHSDNLYWFIGLQAFFIICLSMAIFTDWVLGLVFAGLLSFAVLFLYAFRRGSCSSDGIKSFKDWLKHVVYMIAIFFGYIFLVAVLCSFVENIPLEYIILSHASVIPSVLFVGRLIDPSEYKLQYQGKLLGFRDFIKTANQQDLERLTAQDEMYFYDILPFAVAFGLAEKWEKKFRNITLRPANWYTYDTTSSGFAHGLYMSSLTRSLTHDVAKGVTHFPQSSSSGGGFSGGGGGFSGGGGGGGGVSSW